MDFELFFNHLSVPASSQQAAYLLFSAMIREALLLNSGDDRLMLNFDVDNIEEIPLAEGYPYRNYKNDLNANNEVDLLVSILEMEDKSSFLQQLSDDELEFLTNSMIYIPDLPYDGSMDLIGLASLRNGILLSLPTSQAWVSPQILFFIQPTGAVTPQRHGLRNISLCGHSALILRAFVQEINLRNEFSTIVFRVDMLEWFNALALEDKHKIVNNLRCCAENQFEMGRPLVDSIHGSAIANLKELRAGNSAKDNGKIRILFVRDQDRVVNMLIGFIKHSNDYSIPIAKAEAIYPI